MQLVRRMSVAPGHEHASDADGVPHVIHLEEPSVNYVSPPKKSVSRRPSIASSLFRRLSHEDEVVSPLDMTPIDIKLQEKAPLLAPYIRLLKPFLVLLFLVSYVLLGALYMSMAEGWPYLHAIHFCLRLCTFPLLTFPGTVTLTTVGENNCLVLFAYWLRLR
jgi:hypothetical protein